MQPQLSYHWAVTHGPWGYDQNANSQEDEDDVEGQDVVCNSDELGSDWDSDEVLSGDEDALAGDNILPFAFSL